MRGPFDDAPVWLLDGTLLVVEGGSLHQIVAVDPHSGARRIVYNEVGVGPAPGLGGVFGLLTQSSSSSSWTLVIVDHAGRVLLRHRLPAAAGIDISTGNSPPSLYIG